MERRLSPFVWDHISWLQKYCLRKYPDFYKQVKERFHGKDQLLKFLTPTLVIALRKDVNEGNDILRVLDLHIQIYANAEMLVRDQLSTVQEKLKSGELKVVNNCYVFCIITGRGGHTFGREKSLFDKIPEFIE